MFRSAATAEERMAHLDREIDEDIDRAMERNLCRCGTYVRIREGIHRAAASIADDADQADGAGEGS